MGLFDVEIPSPPQPGDSLFAVAEDWENEANVTRSWMRDAWDLYADGYKRAADQLVEDVLEGRVWPLDTLVYPIVFLYRQYLELRLKQLMPVSGRLLRRSGKIRQVHGLLALWHDVRPRLHEVWPDPPDGQDDAVEALLTEFESWDKGSYSFRYPAGKDGSATLAGLHAINVRHVREMVGRLAAVLDGSSIGMEEMAQLQSEMEAEFRSEMAAEYYGPS